MRGYRTVTVTVVTGARRGVVRSADGRRRILAHGTQPGYQGGAMTKAGQGMVIYEFAIGAGISTSPNLPREARRTFCTSHEIVT